MPATPSVPERPGAPDRVPASDPMLARIVDAIEQIRAGEFDYEVVRAATEVTGEDAVRAWRPSLSYLRPERRGDEYHVTVYAQWACESCPVKRLDVDSIEPKQRALVSPDRIYVHDYFDMFDWQPAPAVGDG